MTTRTKKLATVLTAGVALSSGAYALGSQTGNGGALASSAAASGPGSSRTASGVGVSDRSGRPGGRGLRRDGLGLDALATKLGVTPAALQTALNAIRDEKTPAQRRAELTQALATALGKPVDQVTAAVDSVLPDKPDRGPGKRADFAAALAKALSVDQAKVQAGLDKARQDFGNGPRDRGRNGRRGAGLDTLVNDIASATGADAAKVRSALRGLRPKLGDRRDRHGARDDIRQRLATALSVSPAALDAAFQKVRTQQRDAFATELAQKLSIDPQKVKDALPDFAGPGRRDG
jgi:hypothetical protein